jgi:polysaccharide export outer membrane protein
MIKKIVLWFMAAIFLMQPGLAQSKANDGYKVGVDDVIQVVVIQPDKLDLTLTVAPDGTITFPFIGLVPVQDLTLMEIQEKIQRELLDYMNYPLVSVSLKESHSRIFYVYGEVSKPGSYPLKENMTVLQAVVSAGGFTRTASMSDIKVVRQKKGNGGNGTVTVDLNGKVEPGDVITISQRFF